MLRGGTTKVALPRAGAPERGRLPSSIGHASTSNISGSTMMKTSRSSSTIASDLRLSRVRYLSNTLKTNAQIHCVWSDTSNFCALVLNLISKSVKCFYVQALFMLNKALFNVGPMSVCNSV